MTLQKTSATGNTPLAAQLLRCALRCALTIQESMARFAPRARLVSAPLMTHYEKFASVRSSRAPRIFTPLENMKRQHSYSTAGKRTNFLTGFTLIEIIIVVGLLAVVVSFGMTMSMSSIARSNTIAERDLYVSLLTAARARAIANVDESAHGVYIDTTNSEYVTYSGTSYSSSNPTNISVPMVSSADFDFTDGSDDVSFAPLSIRVSGSQTGTTTITTASQEYAVNVNALGRIDW